MTGAPPCQRPECGREAHFRSGYTHCLGCDTVDVQTWDVEPEPVGIATSEFTFYFGASCGSSRKTLRQTEEPNVMLSYATRTNTPWPAIETLMVDSGGYSLLERGETEYPGPVGEYLDYVVDVDAAYWMTRDIPASPDVVADLEHGVDTAIARTVALTRETLDAYSERGNVPGEPVAVLQGTTPDEYIQCYHELVRADYVTGRLAIGSLKPHTASEQIDIITRVRAAIDEDTEGRAVDVGLHGLGVDVDVLEHAAVQRALTSADSSRYISTARWRANRDELPPRLREDEPRVGWYEVLRAYLDMRADLRDVLYDPRAATDGAPAGALERDDGQAGLGGWS